MIQGSTVLLRAERSRVGNGRFYHVDFLAEDGHGATCAGTVKVVVKNRGIVPVDEGPLYDSTQP